MNKFFITENFSIIQSSQILDLKKKFKEANNIQESRGRRGLGTRIWLAQTIYGTGEAKCLMGHCSNLNYIYNM